MTVVSVGRGSGSGVGLKRQVAVGKMQVRYRGHWSARVCVAEWSGPHAAGSGLGERAVLVEVRRLG